MRMESAALEHRDAGHASRSGRLAHRHSDKRLLSVSLWQPSAELATMWV